MPQVEPNIYQYYDYQKYLKDYYDWKKLDSSYFSYRYISKKVDLNHGFIIKILKGERNLSPEKIEDFQKLLKLSKRRAKYFELMVYYGRAKSESETKHYFEQLLSFTDIGTQEIEKKKYEFYQKWYYTAVRETLNFYPFNGNYQELSEIIEPKITLAQAKKAVQLLKHLEMIKKNESGYYTLTSKFITTEQKWKTLAVKSFQSETIELALQALKSIEKERRDISTVSLSINGEAIEKIKDRISQFHQDLLEIADSCPKVDRSYQINIQVFPLSKAFIQEVGS